MEIFDDILKTLGRTPLIHLKRFFPGKAVLAAKVESFNPGSSVKDRVGIAMIEAAEKSGKLKPGGKIVEPTSGNTGVGLAMAANLKGYKLICTASDKIPKEKVALLEAYGARVITCPASVAPEDPRSYYRVAEKIRDQEGAFLPNQYSNPANPEAHYRTTGPEIWKQTDGKITHWVTGIGTGGTISGTAKFLKEKNPGIRVIGIDIEGSVFEFYKEHGKMPPSENIHQYLTDGLGEDFIPDCVWWNYIDEVITVSDKTAYQTTLEVTRKEGIFCGASGGAAAAGARKVAETLPGDALVVTLFPDSGERYLSKLNQTWLRKHNLLD